MIYKKRLVKKYKGNVGEFIKVLLESINNPRNFDTEIGLKLLHYLYVNVKVKKYNGVQDFIEAKPIYFGISPHSYRMYIGENQTFLTDLKHQLEMTQKEAVELILILDLWRDYKGTQHYVCFSKSRRYKE